MLTNYTLPGRACSERLASSTLIVYRNPAFDGGTFNGAPYSVEVEGNPNLKTGVHCSLGKALKELRDKVEKPTSA